MKKIAMVIALILVCGFVYGEDFQPTMNFISWYQGILGEPVPEFFVRDSANIYIYDEGPYTATSGVYRNVEKSRIAVEVINGVVDKIVVAYYFADRESVEALQMFLFDGLQKEGYTQHGYGGTDLYKDDFNVRFSWFYVQRGLYTSEIYLNRGRSGTNSFHFRRE